MKEEDNAKFFADNKMSIKVNNVEDLTKQAQMLLDDETLQQELINNQIKYINKYSAADMIKYILEQEVK